MSISALTKSIGFTAGVVDVSMQHLSASLAGSPWAHLLTASYSPLTAQRAAASAGARSSSVQVSAPYVSPQKLLVILKLRFDTLFIGPCDRLAAPWARLLTVAYSPLTAHRATSSAPAAFK